MTTFGDAGNSQQLLAGSTDGDYATCGALLGALGGGTVPVAATGGQEAVRIGDPANNFWPNVRR